MKKRVTILCSILLVCAVMFSACSKPKWELKWNIENCTGFVGHINDARQTFTVYGDITLENYDDCEEVLIIMDAIDQMGYVTELSCILSIGGDGTYSFSIKSVYKTQGGLIATIKNAKVEKL